MRGLLVTLLKKLIFLRKVALRILRDKDTYFKDTAWPDSIVSKLPLDENGLPIPIYPYVIVDLLKQRLNLSMKVMEFGAGYSTLFYQSRVRKVCSVEHHKIWYEKISALAKSNVDMRYIPLEEGSSYENACKQFSDKFDLIVIDGRRRTECVANCLPYLDLDGVIIWDDSNRERYQSEISQMKDRGFKRLDFNGLKATSWDNHQTTLFYRENNCFNL